MATVVGVTAAKADSIEGQLIVSAAVSNGSLILTRENGSTIVVPNINSSGAVTTHEQDTSTHGVSEVAGVTETQTLTNKTLVTPNIGSFVNAKHTHGPLDAEGGPVTIEHLFSDTFTARTLNTSNPGPYTMASIPVTAGLYLVITTCRGFSTNGQNIGLRFFLDNSTDTGLTAAGWGGTYPEQARRWDGTGDNQGFTLAGLFSGSASENVRLRVEIGSGGSGTATTATIGLISAIRLGPTVTLT